MFQQTEEKGGTKKKQTQLDWILFVGFQLSSTTQLMFFLLAFLWLLSLRRFKRGRQVDYITLYQWKREIYINMYNENACMHI